MSLIEWNQGLSVQIKEMDGQHTRLVGIINDLHEAMLNGKGSQEIESIIAQMIEYTQFHFVNEEKLMAAHNYPGFIHHKAEHKAFLDKALEFQNSAAEKKLGLSLVVQNFLREWLTNHIQIEDKKYGKYLNARGIH